MLLAFRNNPELRKRSKPLHQQKMIDFQGKTSKFLSEVDFFDFGFWGSFWSFSQLRRSYVFRFLEFFAFETLFRILVSILGNLTWNSGFWSHPVLIRLEVSEPLNDNKKDQNRIGDLCKLSHATRLLKCFQKLFSKLSYDQYPGRR